jgi:hypothetical protein
MKIDKWILLGYIAAIFNPVPTGIIAGYILFTEKKYRNHGMIVMIVAVFLFVVMLLALSTGSVV